MNFIKTFISEYGMVILYSVLTALAGSVAAFIKKKYKEKCDTKTKQEVVRNCVMMAQQVYRGLDGETKLLTEEFVKSRCEGKTVIIITHDEEEAVYFGGRLLKLSSPEKGESAL